MSIILIKFFRMGAASKESYNEDTYPNLLHRFLKFQDEMSVILVVWRDCQQLIEAYNEQQVQTLNFCKSRMAKNHTSEIASPKAEEQTLGSLEEINVNGTDCQMAYPEEYTLERNLYYPSYTNRVHFHEIYFKMVFLNNYISLAICMRAGCSSVVACQHMVLWVVRLILPGGSIVISHSSQCFTTGITKVMVYTILSVR